MPTLHFTNPGEIDIAGATIAGLSAKSGPNPIGQFGTGLKYAIAWVLANDGSIEIWSGLNKWTFRTSPIEFRGTTHQQIEYRNEHGDDISWLPLNITTHYGAHWEAWQIFRELLANAYDEGGSCTAHPCDPAAGHTVITVNCQPLYDLYSERDNIILPPKRGFDHTTPEGCITFQPCNTQFYRGVRIYTKPSLFTFNILDGITLTEDRTVKYPFMLREAAGRVVMSLTNPGEIRALLCSKAAFDVDIDFPAFAPATPEFLAVALELYKSNPITHARLKSLLTNAVPDSLLPTPIALSEFQTRQLERAIQLCERMGLVNKWPIHVAELDNSLLGLWNPKAEAIYLSPELFRQGTKAIVACLYEELTHAHTGYADCDYPMQTHLFNTIVTLWEEHILQEPF